MGSQASQEALGYGGKIHGDGEVEEYFSQFPSRYPTHEENVLVRNSSVGLASTVEKSFAAHDNELVDPVLRTPFSTDLASLMCSNGSCSENAKEVWRAVSMSTEPRHGWELQDGPNYEADVRDGKTSMEVECRLADGEVLPATQQLSVPSQFKELTYDWAAPSAEQSPLTTQQQDCLKGCLKLFVNSMLQGVMLQLRLDQDEVKGTQGKNIEAKARLSKDLRNILISVGGMARTVPINSIRWVRPAEKDSSSYIWFLPSDRNKMVILRLAGGRFLRFRFEEEVQAAYFGTCMRLLAKAAQADLQK